MELTHSLKERVSFCPGPLSNPHPLSHREPPYIECGDNKDNIYIYILRGLNAQEKQGFFHFHFVPKHLGQIHFVPGQNQSVLFCPTGQNKSPSDKMKSPSVNLRKLGGCL